MRIVITVIGHDRVGIVAGVATACAESGINIVDINQNILEGYFNMVLIADLPATGFTLRDAQSRFATLGEELGVQIRVQSEQIFCSMHHV